jgi:hypothetical protein
MACGYILRRVERIVFVSLFLGLVSGTQWVEMRADPEVKTIRITLGSHEVAALARPPWQTAIDFGGDLEPSQLVATGFNDRGEVVASASQFLNLPRPVAELEIVLEKKHETPAALALLWHHREHAQPRSAVITLDGARLRVPSNFSARLPPLDPHHSHVLAAEMRFRDGAVARCDLVIHGGFSDTVGTQLTPIALNRASPQESDNLDGCFTVDGEPVRTAAYEKTDALVIIVKDPDPVEAQRVLDPKRAMLRRGAQRDALRHELQLDTDTTARILWPVASQIAEPGEPSTKLFLQSTDQAASRGGVRWLLTRDFSRSAGSTPRQFADAVAAAGLRALGEGRRRAVILLLSRTADTSYYMPAAVRQYLAAIGVPLFVWSLTGPRPDLADSWGPVDDISTTENLRRATDRLRETLTVQRVAWVALDPLTSLRVQARERCGVSPLARLRAK